MLDFLRSVSNKVTAGRTYVLPVTVRLHWTLLVISCASVLSLADFVHQAMPASTSDRLTSAYPDCIETVDGNAIHMRNGKVFSTDSSCGVPEYERWLDNATLADQCLQEYSKGQPSTSPVMNSDPGRARFTPFFDAMYGNTAQSVLRKCRQVRWTDGSSLSFTTVNHVDVHMQKIVQELAALGPKYSTYLTHPGGSFNWRTIAGTDRRSAHSYGIAIDINTKMSDYWRSNVNTKNAALTYRNRIPWNIVEVFEKHGFIWGGKWYHYDTMHFEFRPELCAMTCNCVSVKQQR